MKKLLHPGIDTEDDRHVKYLETDHDVDSMEVNLNGRHSQQKTPLTEEYLKETEDADLSGKYCHTRPCGKNL